MSKVKVTFVLPEPLQKDLRERMLRDGYDLKGKSRWVSEAVGMLLETNDYSDLVKLNDEMSGFDKLESIVIDPNLKIRINEAALTVRKKYPVIEGVQSRIMRTAIVQRLLRFERFSN